MNVLQRLKNIWGNSERDKLQNQLNEILYAYMSAGKPIYLPDDMATYISDGYLGNVNVYPIIRKIVDPAMGVKWRIADNSRNGDDATDTALLDLLNNPNPQDGRNNFMDSLLTWRLLTGNRFIYWLAPENGVNKGKPGELWSLPVDKITMIASGDIFAPIKEIKLTIGDTYKPIPVTNVIHGKNFNPKYDANGNQLWGVSPLKAALKVLTTSNNGYDALNSSFINGGPPVIVTGKEGSMIDWTQEQAKTLEERFNRKHAGSANRGKWAFQKAPVEVHEIGLSPVDLNVLAALKLSLRDYCNIYNVPSVLLNDAEYSTYNNMKEAVKMLWNNAVIPQLEFLRDDLNKVAAVYNKVTGQNLSYEYDLSDIPELQTDFAIQAQGLAAAWWMTPDERREAMGLEPMGLTDLMLPMGLMSMSELNQPDVEPSKSQNWYERTGIKY